MIMIWLIGILYVLMCYFLKCIYTMSMLPDVWYLYIEGVLFICGSLLYNNVCCIWLLFFNSNHVTGVIVSILKYQDLSCRSQWPLDSRINKSSGSIKYIYIVYIYLRKYFKSNISTRTIYQSIKSLSYFNMKPILA